MSIRSIYLVRPVTGGIFRGQAAYRKEREFDMGMNGLQDVDIKGEKEKEAAQAKAAEAVQAEAKILFEKKYDCPVCASAFTSKTVRSGKTRLLGTDVDLRARYEGIDMNKYDVVMCPKCGYAALSRFFSELTKSQAALIREKLGKSVKVPVYNDPIYTYPEARKRYTLALADAMVKRAKAGEIAYICLKSGWLARSYRESLQEDMTGTPDQIAELEKQEDEYMSKAYKGFIEARQTEDYPICGMDETTLDYLLAALAVRYKEFDVASRLVATVISSPSASPRMKDKARDLKEEILVALKKNQ